MQKKNDTSFVFGFVTGLLAFGAFDFLRDRKKRKELISDIKYLEKEAKPYIKELRGQLIESQEFRNSVQTVDSMFGCNLEGYIKGLGNTEYSIKKDSAKKISSVRRFFKFKK